MGNREREQRLVHLACLVTGACPFVCDALATAETYVNMRTTVATSDELKDTQAAFAKALGWPAARRRAGETFKRRLQTQSDFEYNMGHELGQL